MQVSVIWLNPDIAKFFHVSAEQMQRDEVKKSLGALSLLSSFPKLIEKLVDRKRLLVCGPCDFKDELLDYLRSEHPNLMERVVGCEHMTNHADSEIARVALQYFSKPIRSK
jgi:stalled ribosome rescue protein Dom34